ncbi:MAG: hypothetical protein Q9215_004118 [Flavoplaca cf. flavocitrina]
MRHQPGQELHVYSQKHRPFVENDAESHASFIVISADDPSDFLVKVKDVVGTRLPTTTIERTAERDLCYSMQWAVCTELLSQEQFRATFSSPEIDPLPQLEKLERGAFYYMQRFLGELAADNVPPQFQKLYASMASLKVLGDLVGMDDCGQLLGAIGGNLLLIMEETIEPMSIIQHKNKLEKYYLNMDIIRRGHQIDAAVVSNLAFQNPKMRILEIGGASAAATTKILEALGSSFVSYHFTDATPKYLDNAKEACNAWGDKMNYTIFDTDKDPSEQGLELGSYDLVFSSNVLYNTANTTVTLNKVRSLLHVGGKLLFSEPTANCALGYCIFGSLPGTAERQDGLCLTESHWDRVLKTTCFSGIDASVQPGITTGHLTDMELDDQYGIVLALETPFWSDITEDDLKKMQRLIASAHSLLWLCLHHKRVENAGFRFVTLDLEEQQVHPKARITDTIMKVFKHAILQDNESKFFDELEFTEIDGMLQISRALLDQEKDQFIMRETYEPVAVPQQFHQPDRPLTLTVGQVGLLDSIHYVDDKELLTPLKVNEVEISIAAVGMNFIDIMMSLGQITPSRKLGQECSGTISAIGQGVHDLAVGDRVLCDGSRLLRELRQDITVLGG